MSHGEKLESSPSRLGGLFRDLAAGMKQQMFYWGRDVLHPSGNLFIRQGLAKTPSAGLQGTSCYGCEWEGGRIELHGACAGWYPRHAAEEGFVYVRPKGQCFRWRGTGAPVPGEWPAGLLAPPAREVPEACHRFLDWWMQSERWVEETQGREYRRDCYRIHKRLPKAKSWLPPGAARAWLEAFRRDPSGLERAKQFRCGEP